jgi:two-component system, LytTR family, response regulator
MINCFIVDDEQHAIDVLSHHMSEVHFFHLAGSSTNPVEAVSFINENKVDLVFVDVQMPKISGLELIKSIQKPVRFILVTAYTEFAVEGFELEVLDYLMKPVPFARFLKAAQKAFNTISPKDLYVHIDEDDIEGDYLFVKTETKGKMLKINLMDIEYVEGMKNYIAIYHNGMKTPALLNMKDLEERLPRKYFCRVHKSFIASIPRIAMIEGNIIRLKGGKVEIPVGETYKVSFLEQVKNKIMD